jgi:hypothetical protein
MYECMYVGKHVFWGCQWWQKRSQSDNILTENKDLFDLFFIFDDFYIYPQFRH